MTIRWETCADCGKQYRYPYLCREHMLCGVCHPPLDQADYLDKVKQGAQ